MAKGRVIGTAKSRVVTRGREIQGGGNPVGKSNKRTRPIPMPRVQRIYDHCEGVVVDKESGKKRPCKSPNVKGERFCQGHLNQRAARRRAQSEPRGN